MMKKLLTLFFALIVLQGAWAYDFTVAGIYYNITSGSTVEVTARVMYSPTPAYTGSITIPSTVTYSAVTYNVTSIGGQVFEGCTNLTSITIPNSVTSIGFWAFQGCTGLTSIAIPSSVISIGNEAFSGTAWYNNKPNGLVYAGNVAYKYKGIMPARTSISLNVGTTGIAGEAFWGCTGLTSVTIPSSVTSIGVHAFRGCSGLTSVTIPSSITSIGYGAFRDCIGLTSISIPISVTSIGEAAFDNCSGLTSVNYNATNCIVMGSATEPVFRDCTALRTLTIGSNVTTIPADAFLDCLGLTSITIPSSVTSIGGDAFFYCTGLSSITIPSSVTSIGYQAFYNCSGLTSVNYYATNCTVMGSATNPVFSGCTALRTLTIGSNVTVIPAYAFKSCTGLTSIYAYPATPVDLISSSNVFLNVNKTSCTLYVPEGSLGLYQAANQWQDFANIVSLTPTLTTTAASSITNTSSIVGGNVINMGVSLVTARGICWSTTINPTIAENKTSNGTGIGAFTSSITGLTPTQTYHIRAYATNSVGTSYGSDLTFTTLGTAPTITSTTVSNITTTTASAGGNVTDAGTSTVTARGVCWSTTANPTIANSKTTDGIGIGVFSSLITGLTSSVTYHIRAYATSSVGTSYGTDITFTTLGTAPTVTTTTVSNITNATAKTGGNITSTGTSTITALGVCWSTVVNPTIANSKTTDGSEIGTFTSIINGLTPAQTYHIRAYATNSVGTSYGSDLSFTTSAIVPASFSLSAPANGGWTTTTPLFQWATSTGAFSYKLYIDDVLKKENITTTSYQLLPTETLSSGMHTWYVVAGDGYAVQSNETWNLRVDATQPTAFSLVSPTDNSWTASTPTLTWGASSDVNSGLAKYQLWIDGVLNRDNIVTTTTSSTPTTVLTNSNHTWEIRAVDNVGNVRNSTQILTIKVDNMTPSFTIEAINDTTIQKGQSLQLGIKPILYNVKISFYLENTFYQKHFFIKNSITGKNVFGISVNENIYHDWNGGNFESIEKMESGDYYIDALRAWEYSVIPSVGTHLNNNTFTVGGTDYTYSWMPETYLDNASIANPTATPLTDTQYIVTVNTNQGCIAKDTLNVKVINNTGQNLQKATNDYVIYPNPVSESFQIYGTDEIVTIKLTDVSGRTMLSKQVFGNEQIFVSSLPKGLYIVKIYTNKGGIERKLVKK